MNKSTQSWGLVFLLVSRMALAAPGGTDAAEQSFSTVTLSAPGKKPQYGAELCVATVGAKPARAALDQSDETAVRALTAEIGLPNVGALWTAVPEEIMWWIRISSKIDFISVPRAFHEANHILDFALSRCRQERSTYMFDGNVYVTELRRGGTPPYRIAERNIPPGLKAQPLGRFYTYFVKTEPLPGNDFTTLVDELNAYIGAGRVELELARHSHLYSELRERKFSRVDGNLGGTADFMLYVLCYLKAVRESDADAYMRIKNSPLFVSHLQRLWTSAERLLQTASPYGLSHGGVIDLSEAALSEAYQPDLLRELDILSISHTRTKPILD